MDNGAFPLFTNVMDDDALFSQALTADDIRGLFDD